MGSAIGFLRAPISYEIVRSRLARLAAYRAAEINRLFADMRAQAETIVRAGAGNAALVEARHAFMRYCGQGHEVLVPLPVRTYGDGDGATLASAFEGAYCALYSRVIPGVDIEVAKVEPHGVALLSDFDPFARHFEVVHTADGPGEG